MAQENMAKMREQLELKDMTNRIRALDNRPPIPDTEEESMVRRLQNLGGKRRKTVSKGKRREKTRKGRKGRKGRKTNRRRK